VDGNKLCDLDYADDIALTETSQTGMQLTEEVEKISRRVGLRMNSGKCKSMVAVW